MSSSYDIYQQVYGLSMASNLVTHLKGNKWELMDAMVNGFQPPPPASFQPGLQPTIDKLGGRWEVVWGPVVWKKDDWIDWTGAGNVWFVAKAKGVLFPDGQTKDAYVIAIAGTADASSYDWLVEDGDVNSVVDIFDWINSGLNKKPETARVKNGTYIAAGTAGGLYNLLNTEAQYPGTGKGLLVDYLKTIPAAARVIFTGHSLGGALAPSLALILLNSQLLSNLQTSNVLTYPTAGPSPGNAKFADLFAETFHLTGTDYKAWNSNLWNAIDMVPQAWCTDATLSPARNLTNPPQFYGKKGLALQLELDAEFALLAGDADWSKIIYMPLPGNSFQGAAPANPPKTQAEFFGDAGYQHTVQYSKHIGFSIDPTLAQDIPKGVEIKKGLSSKTTFEVLQSYPVINNILKKPGVGEKVRLEVTKDNAEGKPV